MPESAQTVAATVAKVMTATRSNKVDLVGHSQGGIVARYYINALGGNRVVDKMVLLSSPYVATGLPIDVLGVAKRVIPKHLYDAVLYNGKLPPLGFNFIDPWAFSVSEPLATGIQYTQITDIADEVGIAGGMQPPRGATNATTEYINTYCPTDFSQHFAQPYSPTGTALVANALDPRHPRTPPCTVVPLYSLGG